MNGPRRPLIAGNWKMNKTGPDARAYCERLVALLGDGGESSAEVVVCPPFTALESVAFALAGTSVSTAAQAVHEAVSGAHTGEVSAVMIAAAGARGAIVGHSERRAAGETDAQVAARIRAALDQGLFVIMCVGESLELRDAGDTLPWLSAQVAAGLAHVTRCSGRRGQPGPRVVRSDHPVRARALAEVTVVLDGERNRARRCRRASLRLVRTRISLTPHGEVFSPPSGAIDSAGCEPGPHRLSVRVSVNRAHNPSTHPAGSAPLRATRERWPRAPLDRDRDGHL